MFLYTQEHFCSRFLYYFCLCKSFKEHFLFKPQPRFLGESECKGTTIINTIQILKQKNSQKHESFRESLQISNTHYILISASIHKYHQYRSNLWLPQQKNTDHIRLVNQKLHSHYSQVENPYKLAAYIGQKSAKHPKHPVPSP